MLGMPQGSVFGPTLFNLYAGAANLLEFPRNKMALCADDTIIHYDSFSQILVVIIKHKTKSYSMKI